MTTYAVTVVASAVLTFSVASTVISQQGMRCDIAAGVPSATYSGQPRLAGSLGASELLPSYQVRRIAATAAEVPSPSQVQYPTAIKVAAGIVIGITVIGALLGYFVPGPITGAILPVAASFWWGLYRIILRYDEGIASS